MPPFEMFAYSPMKYASGVSKRQYRYGWIIAGRLSVVFSLHLAGHLPGSAQKLARKVCTADLSDFFESLPSWLPASATICLG